MIKVCHMTSAHGKEDDRIFGKECVSLANAGYEVYLIEKGDSYKKSGVNIIGVGDISTNRIKRLFIETYKVYSKALETDSTIYHLHDPELLPYALLLKLRGKKVIFDSHERYTYQIRCKPYLPKLVSSLLSSVYSFIERIVLNEIDAVIFPCLIDNKNPFEGMCKRVSIISNAAVLGEFYDLYDSRIKKNSNQICYVGSISETRGITNNILAASDLGIKIAIAGSFSSNEYLEKIKKYPSFKYVDYKGELNRREVADLIAQSNLGLCTLLDVGQYFHLDTFSVKVFEYMSMGIPVLLHDSPFNCKMIDQYKFGICVNPENLEEMKKAIKSIIDNPDQAKQMGINGRKAIKEVFNWGIEEKKLLKLYNDLI